MAVGQVVEPNEVVHEEGTIYQFLRAREYQLGGKMCMEDQESRFHRLYSYFGSGKPKCFYVRPPWTLSDAIFNLKFNATGIIVAVCASGGFVVADPRVIGCIVQQSGIAHTDCANVLTFLNDTHLVTGSDDCLIKLWDMRKLSKPFYTLEGHSNWVKNLEYDNSRQWLYSSAFDCTVRMWDLQKLEASPKTLVVHPTLFRMCMPTSGEALTFSIRGDELFSVLPQEWYSNQESAIMAADGGVDLCHDLVKWHSTSFFIPFMEENEVDSARIPTHLAWTTSCGGHKGRCHRVRLELEPPVKNIYSVCFNPAGERLAMRGTTLFKQDSRLIQRDIILTYQFSGCEHCSLSECQNASHRILGSAMLQQCEQGIIKEVSFDPSGRYIVSPAHKDVLIFDSITCRANVIGKCPGDTQKDHVLTCQFSPNEPVIASGDMSGHIGFHYPR